MSDFQIFSHASGILSTELLEKCGNVLPWDQNNEFHKICLASDVTQSLTIEKQCLLEGSWHSMVTVYNSIASFLEVNFGTKPSVLAFQDQEQHVDANITTLSTVTDTCINANSSRKPLTDDCTGDIVIQSYCSVDEQKQTKHAVPEPIIYFTHDEESLSTHKNATFDAAKNKVTEYIKEKTVQNEEESNSQGNISNSPKIKEESLESIEIDQTLENNVETFKKVDKISEHAEGPTMQTRKRKSLAPRKSTKAAINKKLNNKKQIIENGHDKNTQKKPSSLKPKKSWSQKILEDESVKDQVDDQSNENEGKDINNINTDNQSSTEIDHEPVNEKESDNEWTPENNKEDYFRIKGKSLKITLKKSPRKKSGKKKNKASSSTKITEENDDYFTCVDCSYVSNKKINLREHIQRMHKDKVWSCEFCSKIFSIQKDLVRHEKSHLGPELCCDFCGKMYKSRRTFINHKKSHEENYIKPEYECNVCNKSFSTKYVRDYHVKSEHLGMKKLFLCPTCGKSFTQKNSYIQHANVHMGLKPYQCEHCGKSFAYEKSLKEHRFMHDEILHFKCEVCDKLFRQKSALQIHKKIHQVTKDHLCGICGKGFTQRQALLRHERIHNGDKPFKCGLCARTFSDASIIRRHMILVHKKNSKEWREDVICDLKGADDYWIEGKKPEGRIKRLPSAKKTNNEEAVVNNEINVSEPDNLVTPTSKSQEQVPVVEEIIQVNLNNQCTENHELINRETVNQSSPDDGYIDQNIYVPEAPEQYLKDSVMYMRKNAAMLHPNSEGSDMMLSASNITQYLQNPHISAETSSSMNLDQTFNDTFTNITERKTEQHSYHTNVRTGNQWTAEPYHFNTMHYLPHFSNYQNQ